MTLPVQFEMAADERSELIIAKQQKTTPPVAEPQEGCLNFYEMEKYGVRLSHNVLGD